MLNPFHRRLLLTLAGVALYRLGLLIPIPFIDPDVQREVFNSYATFGHSASERISILSLGLMPYVSASILVEIFSLFVPALKRHRRGAYEGRRKLRQIALFLTLGVSAIQACGIVNGIAELNAGPGRKLLILDGPFEYTLLVGVLVTGVYLLIGLAQIISKYGVGHGISILILAGICSGIFARLDDHLRIIRFNGLSVYIWALLVLLGMAAVTLLFLKAHRSIQIEHNAAEGVLTALPLNGCPASAVPIGYATSVIMLPLTLAALFDWDLDIYGQHVQPGSLLYALILAALIFGFSYLFAWLFLHPKRRIRRLREQGWIVVEDGPWPMNLLRSVLIYNLPWTIWLCILALMPSILISAFDLPFYIGGKTVYVSVAVGLDLIDRYRYEQDAGRRATVKIAELHDVYDAGMIRQQLKGAGISCHMQGYYHRHLLYFFGPYIEISLMVGRNDAQKVRDILRRCYNGLGT